MYRRYLQRVAGVVRLSDLEIVCFGDPCLGIAKLEFKTDLEVRVMFVGETDQRRGCRQTQRLTTFDVDVHMMHAAIFRAKTRVQCTLACTNRQTNKQTNKQTFLVVVMSVPTDFYNRPNVYSPGVDWQTQLTK